MKWLKKFRDSRLLIGGLCILAAAVFAFAVLPKLYNKKASTTTVCRLIADIPAGTKIEAAMITEAEVGSYGLPEAVIRDKAEIVNKYSKAAISKDDLLFPNKFVDYISDEVLDRVMSSGQRLVTISLSTTAAGVANHIKPGDRVSIVCFEEDAPDTSAAAIDPDLAGLEVYDIENAQAQSITGADITDDGTGTDAAIPATMTLIADETQALELIKAEYTGQIHIIFETRGGEF